jgi:hypothetical protein
MASLADIYKSEKKQGGGLASTLGKSMMESFDPRNLLDQNGLLTSMFPSLKGYSSKPDKKKDKEKKESSGTSPTKASFDETLSNLGTKTTFERLYKAQVMSLKYTSVLPEISKDLKNINNVLKGMIEKQSSGGILDSILDALGLSDMFGGRKVKPGARERLKRIKAIKAERLAKEAAAAKASTTAPKPEVKANALQQKGKPPAGANWDEKANRWRDAKTGRFVKAEISKETLKDVIKGKLTKYAGKIVPGLGIAFGLYDVFERVKKGDYTGVGIATGSAIASTFPGIGTGLAITGVAANMARDIYEEAYGVYPEDDEEGDVAEKYQMLVNMIIEELTKKNIQPVSPENRDKLEPLLNEYKNATNNLQRQKIAGQLRSLGSSMGINADTIDNELSTIRGAKAAESQESESKLLEELSNRQQSNTNEATGTVRRTDSSAGGGRGFVNPELVGDTTTPSVDFPTRESGNEATLEPPTPNVPSPPAPSLDTGSPEISSVGSGQKISAISASVGDAQLAAASAPIVTSIPAKSSMNTPPSDEVDMTRLPVASAYNEEFMTEFFGSRQQSFATG